jgi:hypothetical protein
VGETPGPIPNPEVKPFSADGTARGTAWESRTPPGIFRRGSLPYLWLSGPLRLSYVVLMLEVGKGV